MSSTRWTRRTEQRFMRSWSSRPLASQRQALRPPSTVERQSWQRPTPSTAGTTRTSLPWRTSTSPQPSSHDLTSSSCCWIRWMATGTSSFPGTSRTSAASTKSRKPTTIPMLMPTMFSISASSLSITRPCVHTSRKPKASIHSWTRPCSRRCVMRTCRSVTTRSATAWKPRNHTRRPVPCWPLQGFRRPMHVPVSPSVWKGRTLRRRCA
mmetsp:Transcript_124581/g.295637  ORF Transcript_124581/g.295637 Transcript_124581/m.295637 type:complete len:209 (-) Transcript_124581:446-1072(-)